MFGNSQNIYWIICSFIICVCGFIAPSLWNIAPLEISNFSKETNYKRTSINLNKSDKLSSNKDYLSSDWAYNNISIDWSKKILINTEKGINLPRMFFSKLPDDLDKYQPVQKKKLFISILLPIVLRSNEIVLQEQKSMKNAFLDNNLKKIEYFAKRYKVQKFKKIDFNNISFLQLVKIKKELLNKMDKIPNSMILAQAAIESGWGSSRFAKEGNALFGEWTWKHNSGLKPRENLNAKFSVKSFVNISASVNSYILNLNSHPAYKKMRNFRSLKIKNGKNLSGIEMAIYLDKYAEIGLEYVKKVTNIIKSNQFNKFDNIKLENYHN